MHRVDRPDGPKGGSYFSTERDPAVVGRERRIQLYRTRRSTDIRLEEEHAIGCADAPRQVYHDESGQDLIEYVC